MIAVSVKERGGSGGIVTTDWSGEDDASSGGRCVGRWGIWEGDSLVGWGEG